MAKSKFYSHVFPRLRQIAKWAEEGATDREIAKKLGVSYSSFMAYLAKGKKGEPDYSDFSDTLARAGALADDDVEASLFKMATGYSVMVRKPVKVRRAEFDKTGRRVREYEEVVITQEEKYIEPSVQAQTFWLTNRRKDKWEYRPVSIKNADSGEEVGVMLIAPVDELKPPEEDIIDVDGEVVG